MDDEVECVIDPVAVPAVECNKETKEEKESADARTSDHRDGAGTTVLQAAGGPPFEVAEMDFLRLYEQSSDYPPDDDVHVTAAQSREPTPGCADDAKGAGTEDGAHAEDTVERRVRDAVASALDAVGAQLEQDGIEVARELVQAVALYRRVFPCGPLEVEPPFIHALDDGTAPRLVSRSRLGIVPRTGLVSLTTADEIAACELAGAMEDMLATDTIPDSGLQRSGLLSRLKALHRPANIHVYLQPFADPSLDEPVPFMRPLRAVHLSELAARFSLWPCTWYVIHDEFGGSTLHSACTLLEASGCHRKLGETLEQRVEALRAGALQVLRFGIQTINQQDGSTGYYMMPILMFGPRREGAPRVMPIHGMSSVPVCECESSRVHGYTEQHRVAGSNCAVSRFFFELLSIYREHTGRHTKNADSDFYK